MNKKKKNKKKQKKLLIEKQNIENKQKIENDINKILDGLTIEELTELENMGDFSKEAIEWIRSRKRRKKTRKNQEDFEKRLRCSEEVIRRTILIGKIEGFKNGQYKPKNKIEENEIIQELNADIERNERIKEREIGEGRSSKSGGRSRGERER